MLAGLLALVEAAVSSAEHFISISPNSPRICLSTTDGCSRSGNLRTKAALPADVAKAADFISSNWRTRKPCVTFVGSRGAYRLMAVVGSSPRRSSQAGRRGRY